MSRSRTLIVLAGGRSRRMGRDKAQLPTGAGTLLERIIGRLSPVVDQVIVAGGRPPSNPELRWVPDARPGAGPLAGIAAGLAAMSGELGWAVACDLPDVEPGLGELLFAAASVPAPPFSPPPVGEGQGGVSGEGGASGPPPLAGEGEGGGDVDVDAVVPRLDGQPEGLCAVYRRSLGLRILAMLDAGERRVSAVLDVARVRYVDAAELRRVDPELRSFRNLNTPDEYQAWVTSLR